MTCEVVFVALNTSFATLGVIGHDVGDSLASTSKLFSFTISLALGALDRT